MPISTRSRAATTSSTTRASAPVPAPVPAAAVATRPAITKKRASKKNKNKTATATAAKASPNTLLPDVTLPCDDGQPRQILSLLTEQTPGMILFTYPRANTAGCTTQACGLSSLSTDAKSAGYVTVGASYDSVKSQASWKLKHSMQLERLMCDTLDIGLLKKLGAHKAPKSVKRSVFVIRKGGLSGKGDQPVIVESHISISPKDCISFVEKYVKDHPCNEKVEAPAEDDGEKEADAKEVTDDGKDKPEEKDDENMEKKEEENAAEEKNDGNCVEGDDDKQ